MMTIYYLKCFTFAGILNIIKYIFGNSGSEDTIDVLLKLKNKN